VCAVRWMGEGKLKQRVTIAAVRSVRMVAVPLKTTRAVAGQSRQADCTGIVFVRVNHNGGGAGVGPQHRQGGCRAVHLVVVVGFWKAGKFVEIILVPPGPDNGELALFASGNQRQGTGHFISVYGDGLERQICQERVSHQGLQCSYLCPDHFNALQNFKFSRVPALSPEQFIQRFHPDQT